MKISKQLYNHVKSVTKISEADFVSQAKTSIVVDAMVAHLKQLLKEAEASPVGSYDCPSWSHKQADKNGEIRVLKTLIDQWSNT